MDAADRPIDRPTDGDDDDDDVPNFFSFLVCLRCAVFILQFFRKPSTTRRSFVAMSCTVLMHSTTFSSSICIYIYMCVYCIEYDTSTTPSLQSRAVVRVVEQYVSPMRGPPRMKQVTEMSFTSARPDKHTRRLALYPSIAMKRAPESPPR